MQLKEKLHEVAATGLHFTLAFGNTDSHFTFDLLIARLYLNEIGSIGTGHGV